MYNQAWIPQIPQQGHREIDYSGTLHNRDTEKQIILEPYQPVPFP